MSEAELNGTLLGIQDVPVGYSQDPPDPGSTGNNDKTFCDYVPPYTPKISVRRDFTKGGGVSVELLSISLRQFDTTEQAKSAFDALTHALESCTVETYQGTKLTYAPMAAPKVGDGSVGVKINADGTDLLQFFVLSGPTLINTGGGGPLNASVEDVTSLLEAQVNSYKSTATK